MKLRDYQRIDIISNKYYNIYRCSSLVLAGPLEHQIGASMNNDFNNCVVYKHTNKINGKCYIGIVLNGRKPEHRWGINGCNYLDNKQYKFARAILKYGWDNFEHEILFVGLTVEEAKAKEKELIKKYDSYKNGYNSTLGGDGSLGLKHSKETKEKLRRQHLGTKATEEARKKMSLSQIRFREKLTFEERKKIFGLPGKKNGMYGSHRIGEQNPFFGRKHTQETKDKISKANSGRISNKRKPVIQYDLEMNFIKEWSSVTEAANSFGNNSCGHICDCCNGKRNIAYGYIWKYKE